MNKLGLIKRERLGAIREYDNSDGIKRLSRENQYKILDIIFTKFTSTCDIEDGRIANFEFTDDNFIADISYDTSLVNDNNISFIKTLITLNNNILKIPILDKLYNENKIKDYIINTQGQSLYIMFNTKETLVAECKLYDEYITYIIYNENEPILDISLNRNINQNMVNYIKDILLKIIEL